MDFCTKCGSQLKPDARFCGSCGSTIENRNISYESQPLFHTPNLEFRMPNTQRRIVNLWLILMSIFLFCVFLPSIIGLDGMDGGFAMSFVAGFMVIISIVVILVYRSRARQLDKIIQGEGRIALWRYSPDEWIRFVTRDFEEDKKMKRMLFFLVAGISVVVGIILVINFQDPIFIPIIFGIIAIVAIPALWAPRYRYRKLIRSEATALIAENGVIVGKMFHLWVKLGASLDEISINKEDDPNMIEFTYSMPTRHGRDTQVARVPVPKGRMEEAIKVVDYFNSQV